MYKDSKIPLCTAIQVKRVKKTNGYHHETCWPTCQPLVDYNIKGSFLKISSFSYFQKSPQTFQFYSHLYSEVFTEGIVHR